MFFEYDQNSPGVYIFKVILKLFYIDCSKEQSRSLSPLNQSDGFLIWIAFNLDYKKKCSAWLKFKEKNSQAGYLCTSCHA